MMIRGFQLLMAMTMSVVSSGYGENWPNWRGPDFKGISSEPLPGKLPARLPVLWRAEVGVGFSSVAVEGRRLLTMGNIDGKDKVWCLDTMTGNVLWEHSYACELDPRYYEGGPSATPTINGDSVYTLSKKGHAYCLNLETGDVRWERDLVAAHGFELPEWSFASSPFVDGENVLLNVGRKGLALDRKTGRTVWMPSTETSGYASVVPFGKSKNLLFSASALLCLDGNDGKIWWEYPWKSSRDVNAADPVVDGNRILLSSSAGAELLEMEGESKPPRKIWENKDLKWYFNPGVKIGDHVYSISGTTHRPTELVCTDFATGETVWSEEGFGSGALMAAGETLVLFDKGELILLEADPGGFRTLLRQKVLEGKCWTVPVLANGRIYCRNAEGTLAALGLKE